MGVIGFFFRQDEDGFTTAGSAVAILLAVVLAFGAVQAHWTQSKAGQVQYVADAAALAADGVVAELILYAQTVDAGLLSLSLIGIASFAASAVAAFVPGGEAAAAELADFGRRVFETRDSFAESAKKGLDAAQKLLPALCTMRALDVANANADASGVNYHAVAIPIPTQADQIDIPDDDDVEKSAGDIEAMEEQVEEEVQRQQKAQKELDEAKKDAWMADCGGDVCMRERADTLANLDKSLNPNYTSVDTWTFAAALSRAKSYYKRRFDIEPAQAYQGSPEAVAESVARKAFYRYAATEVSKGSVRTDSQGNERPSLKRLARNTSQIKETFLYTQAAYPISVNGKNKILHAYTGCPKYAQGSPAGYGSVSQVDAGDLKECPECKFSASTLGLVPSPSTSIGNGFEYYYRLVVEASERYNAAADELEASTRKLRKEAEEMKGFFKEALEALAATRLEIQPPGRYGCICIVTAEESGTSIGESFIGGSTELGTRVAMSAATLGIDSSVDQSQTLANVGEKLVPLESVTGSLAKGVFGAWGKALAAYSNGAEGVRRVVEDVIGSIPVVGTDLSQWVGEGFADVAEASGLEPAEVKAYKPILVATSTVLAQDSSSLSATILKAKQNAELASELSAGDFSAVLDKLEGLDGSGLQLGDAGDLVIATLSLAISGLGVGERHIGIDVGADLLGQYASALLNMRGGL